MYPATGLQRYKTQQYQESEERVTSLSELHLLITIVKDRSLCYYYRRLIRGHIPFELVDMGNGLKHFIQGTLTPASLLQCKFTVIFSAINSMSPFFFFILKLILYTNLKGLKVYDDESLICIESKNWNIESSVPVDISGKTLPCTSRLEF